MARGLTDSFGDGLVKFLQELGRLEAAPDADLEFTSQLRDLILERLKGGEAEQDMGGMDQAAAMMPPVGGETTPVTGPEGGPVEVSEPMSRGPSKAADLTNMTEDLRNRMAG